MPYPKLILPNKRSKEVKPSIKNEIDQNIHQALEYNRANEAVYPLGHQSTLCGNKTSGSLSEFKLLNAW